MPVSFPTSKRYFVSFRNGDVGLTPAYPIFTYFKNADTLAPISAPSFTELSNGTYYFDVPFALATDPDIIFQIDGGPSIPTEEIRYQTSMASPKDLFIDEPISQVKDDVWNDVTNRAAGTKGDFVEHIGVDGDAVDAATVFGKVYKARDAIMGGTGYGGTGVDIKTTYDRIGAPVGATISADIAAVQSTSNTINSKIGTPLGTVSSDIAGVQTKLGTPAGASVSADIAAVKSDTALIKAKTDNLPTDPADASDVAAGITAAITSIKGGDNRDLTEIAGSGFASLTDSLVAISAGVGSGLTAGQVSAAVWDVLVSGYSAVPGSFGELMGNLALTTDVTSAVTTIMGGGPNLNQIAGTGFNTGTHSLKLTSDLLVRALGMLHENSVLDMTTFTVDNNLLTGRMRLYDSKANADAAVAASPGVYDTGKIAEYAIVATYTGTNLKTYKVSKE